MGNAATIDNISLNAKAIKTVLGLIAGINADIESSKTVNSPLMVRQYEHLKRQYTKDLLALLADYDLPLTMTEPAQQPTEALQKAAA